jgi:hypothetical protein
MSEGRYEKSASCLEFDSGLAAYLEGEDQPFILAHAKECSLCGTVLADVEQVRSAVRQLPLEEPSPAVWANICATLEQEGLIHADVSVWDWLSSLTFLRNPAAAGALASITILGLALTVPLGHWGLQGEGPLESGIGTSPVASLTASSDNAELARTVGELESIYRAHATVLAPEVKTTFDSGLESLDTSIREVRSSLRQHPDNALAREYLMVAYTRKAEVLTSAVAYEGR